MCFFLSPPSPPWYFRAMSWSLGTKLVSLLLLWFSSSHQDNRSIFSYSQRPLCLAPRVPPWTGAKAHDFLFCSFQVTLESVGLWGGIGVLNSVQGKGKVVGIPLKAKPKQQVSGDVLQIAFILLTEFPIVAQGVLSFFFFFKVGLETVNMYWHQLHGFCL